MDEDPFMEVENVNVSGWTQLSTELFPDEIVTFRFSQLVNPPYLNFVNVFVNGKGCVATVTCGRSCTIKPSKSTRSPDVSSKVVRNLTLHKNKLMGLIGAVPWVDWSWEDEVSLMIGGPWGDECYGCA
jgi:hypothetical protein